MENPICTIKKSRREEIRIAFSQFKKGGKVYDMVSIRTFYDDGTGAGYRPGKNGFNICLRLLPELIEVLQAAADIGVSPRASSAA